MFKIMCFDTETSLEVEHSLISSFSGLYEMQLIKEMYRILLQQRLAQTEELEKIS